MHCAYLLAECLIPPNWPKCQDEFVFDALQQSCVVVLLATPQCYYHAFHALDQSLLHRSLRSLQLDFYAASNVLVYVVNRAFVSVAEIYPILLRSCRASNSTERCEQVLLVLLVSFHYQPQVRSYPTAVSREKESDYSVA